MGVSVGAGVGVSVGRGEGVTGISAATEPDDSSMTGAAVGTAEGSGV